MDGIPIEEIFQTRFALAITGLREVVKSLPGLKETYEVRMDSAREYLADIKQVYEEIYKERERNEEPYVEFDPSYSSLANATVHLFGRAYLEFVGRDIIPDSVLTMYLNTMLQDEKRFEKQDLVDHMEKAKEDFELAFGYKIETLEEIVRFCQDKFNEGF